MAEVEFLILIQCRSTHCSNRMTSYARKHLNDYVFTVIYLPRYMY